MLMATRVVRHGFVGATIGRADGNRTLELVGVILLGYLASQRFVLSSLYPWICLGSALISISYLLKRDLVKALSYTILSLFFLVDNGGGAYPETPTIIRYSIFGLSYGVLLFSTSKKVYVKGLVYYLLLSLSCIVGTASFISADISYFDIETLKRDLIVFVVLLPFCFAPKEQELNGHLLTVGIVGFIIGEIINSILFYDVTAGEYLNYSSTKALVVLPLLNSFHSKAKFLFLFVLTFYVISLYGSRMLMLSFTLLLAISAVHYLIRTKHGLFKAAGPVVALITLTIFVVSANEKISKYKATNILSTLPQMSEIGGFREYFRYLDPVRYGEHSLFFNRSLFEIIVGTGPGSALKDDEGELSFVSFDQTAFSAAELNTSLYANLHDFWIDFGLRFGLLAVLYTLFITSLKPILDSRYKEGALIGVLLLNTTFAMTGILLTALFVRLLKAHPMSANLQ